MHSMTAESRLQSLLLRLLDPNVWIKSELLGLLSGGMVRCRVDSSSSLQRLLGDARSLTRAIVTCHPVRQLVLHVKFACDVITTKRGLAEGTAHGGGG